MTTNAAGKIVQVAWISVTIFSCGVSVRGAWGEEAAFTDLHGLAQTPLLFAAEAPIRLTIAADFKSVIRNRDGSGGGFPADALATKPADTAATLSETGHPERVLHAWIHARGNSSNDPGESDFPKLRLSIDPSEKLAGTIFEDAPTFKINTHLNHSPTFSRTPEGRISDERGPFREGLAYAVAKALGLATPGTRLARITYSDSATGTIFTRNALLLQTDGSVAKMRESSLVDPHAFAAAEASGIDPVEGAQFLLFHALIANRDVGLRVNEEQNDMTEIYRPLWNTYLLKSSDGKLTPVVYDLDLAGAMTGLAASETLDESVRRDVGKLRMHFTTDQLDAGLGKIRAREADLKQTVESAVVDDEGRRLMRASIDGFYSRAKSALAGSVIATETAKLFRDPGLKLTALKINSITGKPGTLHQGTPVRIIRRVRGALYVEITNTGSDTLSGKILERGYLSASTPIADSLSDAQVRTVDLRDLHF